MDEDQTGRSPLDERVVIVTGAGQGLGRAYALYLASLGARVVSNDFDPQPGGESRAERTAREIREAGGEAFGFDSDVTSDEGVPQMVRAAIDRWGQLDAVVNNAGYGRWSQFEAMTSDDFMQMVRVHLFGAWNVTHEAWPHLMKSSAPRVVMVSSSGMMGCDDFSHYAAAKAGVFGLMKALSCEGEKHGIKVNAIWPSADTPMMQDLNAQAGGNTQFASADPSQQSVDRSPDLVAPVVAYLCSDWCSQSGELVHAGRGFLGRVTMAHCPAIIPEIVTPRAVDQYLASPLAAGDELHQIGSTVDVLDFVASALSASDGVDHGSCNSS